MTKWSEQCDDKHRYIERLMKGLDKQSQADVMVLTKQCLARAEQHTLDKSETLLDATLESDAAGGQVAELQESLRVLRQEADDLAAANQLLQGEVAQAAARNEELEHDLQDAFEQRSKVEKLYNDLLEETMKSSRSSTARQSTKVTPEQADLEIRLAEAEAELASMRAKLAERESLEREKRRLLDDLQVSKSEAADLAAEVSRRLFRARTSSRPRRRCLEGW